jgi:hypothetical protein
MKNTLNENSSMREMITFMNDNKILNERVKLINENKIGKILGTLKKGFSASKNAVNSLPKPAMSSDLPDKIKDSIANSLGFAKEQWEDEENQAKLKELGNTLGSAIGTMSSAGSDFFSDSQRMSNTIKGLGIAKWGSVIGAVYGVCIGGDDGNWFQRRWNEVEAVFSGNFLETIAENYTVAVAFVALGLILWASQIILKVIKGVVDFSSVVSGITSFLFKFIKFIFSGIFKGIKMLMSKGKGELNTAESVNLFAENHELIQGDFVKLLIR